MNYSVENLNLVADCDLALASATRERAELNFKKFNATHDTERFAQTSITIESELQSVSIQIIANDGAIAMLPEGPEKEELVYKKMQLEFRQQTLQKRKRSFGIIALLNKQMDLERTNREMEEVEQFVALVDRRKTELIEQAPS